MIKKEVEMGILNAIFGPSKEDIWRQLARDMGGRYTDGGFLGKDILRYRTDNWEIKFKTN